MRVVSPKSKARPDAREPTTTSKQARMRENFFAHLRCQAIANLSAA